MTSTAVMMTVCLAGAVVPRAMAFLVIGGTCRVLRYLQGRQEEETRKSGAAVRRAALDHLVLRSDSSGRRHLQAVL